MHSTIRTLACSSSKMQMLPGGPALTAPQPLRPALSAPSRAPIGMVATQPGGLPYVLILMSSGCIHNDGMSSAASFRRAVSLVCPPPARFTRAHPRMSGSNRRRVPTPLPELVHRPLYTCSQECAQVLVRVRMRVRVHVLVLYYAHAKCIEQSACGPLPCATSITVQTLLLFDLELVLLLNK